jgi:hypothetical protein
VPTKEAHQFSSLKMICFVPQHNLYAHLIVLRGLCGVLGGYYDTVWSEEESISSTYTVRGLSTLPDYITDDSFPNSSLGMPMTKLCLGCWRGGDIKQSLKVGIPKPELGNEKSWYVFNDMRDLYDN